MKKAGFYWTWQGYLLRPAKTKDAKAYYRQNFCPLDQKVAFLTGSKEQFTEAEVTNFFRARCKAEDRLDLLLISPQGKIIGESVINEWDAQRRTANFRLALFHSEDFGKGLGSFMTAVTRDFAFGVLGLERLELSVFSANERAIRTYLSAGFSVEGSWSEPGFDADEKGLEELLMVLTRETWEKRKTS